MGTIEKAFGFTGGGEVAEVQPLIAELERIAQKYALAFQDAGTETYSEQVEEKTRKAKQALTAALQSALAAHPTQQGLDAGNTDADRLIGRLLSSDPDFEDCTAAANLIRELTQNGPDGFATWKDAAVAERVLRVGMQHAIRSLSRVTYGYKSDGDSRYLTSYESSEGQFLRHADVMAAIAAQAKQGGV